MNFLFIYKDKLLVEKSLFSDVLGDVGLDETPPKSLMIKNKKTC